MTVSPLSDLLDHHVGADDQWLCDLEPKRLGGLEIKRQLEATRLLNRQIASRRTLLLRS